MGPCPDTCEGLELGNIEFIHTEEIIQLTPLFGSDRSSRSHFVRLYVYLSVCSIVLSKSLNLHLSSSDLQAIFKQSVSSQSVSQSIRSHLIVIHLSIIPSEP